MAEFTCSVVQIDDIVEHPNADRVEIARVGGYQCVVRKNAFHKGSIAVYIPEGAIVPDRILNRIGLKGVLSGKEKNRVKAIKLRGVVSQGILYPVFGDWSGHLELLLPSEDEREIFSYGVSIGDDVAEMMDIEKWVPPIPTSMNGVVSQMSYLDYVFNFDVDNIKGEPDYFEEGEEVYITEKIHGTFCVVGFIPDAISMREGLDHSILISSKGLWKKGHIFDINNPDNDSNLYVKTIRNSGLVGRFVDDEDLGYTERPIYLLGEVFGKGVQDLHYGADEPRFALFAVVVRRPDGQYEHMDPIAVQMIADVLQVEHVPVLYHGPFSEEKMLELTSGQEAVSGNGVNIREGVVVRSAAVDSDYRVRKSVSENYLFRKGGTEYN